MNNNGDSGLKVGDCTSRSISSGCIDTNCANDSCGSCCTATNPCGLGEGDCDTDDECGAGLRCGTDNCHSDFGWASKYGVVGATDCCERISIWIPTTWFPLIDSTSLIEEVRTFSTPGKCMYAMQDSSVNVELGR